MPSLSKSSSLVGFHQALFEAAHGSPMEQYNIWCNVLMLLLPNIDDFSTKVGLVNQWRPGNIFAGGPQLTIDDSLVCKESQHYVAIRLPQPELRWIPIGIQTSLSQMSRSLYLFETIINLTCTPWAAMGWSQSIARSQPPVTADPGPLTVRWRSSIQWRCLTVVFASDSDPQEL